MWRNAELEPNLRAESCQALSTVYDGNADVTHTWLLAVWALLIHATSPSWIWLCMITTPSSLSIATPAAEEPMIGHFAATSTWKRQTGKDFLLIFKVPLETACRCQRTTTYSKQCTIVCKHKNIPQGCHKPYIPCLTRDITHLSKMYMEIATRMIRWHDWSR